MGWLPIWGPSIVAAVLSVVMAAAFTWAFGVVNERQHRRGVRALIEQEVLDNAGIAAGLAGELQAASEAPESDLAFELILAVGKVPYWERSRWDLPDVGVAFNSMELDKLAQWYSDLSRFAARYEWVLSRIRMLDLKNLHDIEVRTERAALGKLAETAGKLSETTPDIFD